MKMRGWQRKRGIWLLKVGICFKKRSKGKEQSFLGFFLKKESAEKEWEEGLATATLLRGRIVSFCVVFLFIFHSLPLPTMILKIENL